MALSVGNTAPAAGSTAVVGADNIIGAAGYVDIPASHFDGSIEVASDGSAVVYIYMIDGARTVTAVWGPFHLRAWSGVRSPLRRGMGANLVGIDSMTGTEVIITPGRV